MAAKSEQSKQNYGSGPWIFKKGGINKFALVTEQNRNNAIVKGRILYIIELVGRSHMFRGTMSVDPCFEKGWFKYPFKPWQKEHPGHFKVYFNEDMDLSALVKENRFLVNQYIEKNQLYIKPEDPILTYFKTTK